MNPTTSAFNEYSTIRRIALRSPEEAFKGQQRIDEQWKRLHYTSRPDFERAAQEHQQFRKIFASEGIELVMIPGSSELFLDSIYVRDSMINTPEGLILASMGKAERTGEPRVSAKHFESCGFSILGSIEPPGKIEGGDLVWLDQTRCAVGLGYRTNQEGIRQLREMLGPKYQVEVCVLPHQQGPIFLFRLSPGVQLDAGLSANLVFQLQALILLKKL